MLMSGTRNIVQYGVSNSSDGAVCVDLSYDKTWVVDEDFFRRDPCEPVAVDDKVVEKHT